MRVRLECHKPIFVQVVDNPLHVLTICAQIAGKPGDRLRAFTLHNGSQDLPAGAREPEPGHQPVAGGQEQAIEF